MINIGRAYPKKTCDVCGTFRDAKPGVFRLRRGRVVCDYHPNYVATEEAEARPIKTFKVKPVANARPFAPKDTYETAEWQVFNYVASKYRVDEDRVFSGALRADLNSSLYSFGARGAGWAAIYLYELITENKRPRRMITAARAKLAEIADWLLTRIVSYPGRPGLWTSADISWGGFAESGSTTAGANVFTTANSAAAGLGLLRAYQVLGKQDYLDAARATVWHCRSAQSGGCLGGVFSSTDAGGAQRYHFGTFATRTQGQAGSAAHDHHFTPGALVALELYRAFLDVVGDEVIGSSSTATGYSISREALLSTAIAEAAAFWAAGAYDATRGAVVNGLSSSTPFNGFNAFPATKSGTFGLTGTGSWRYLDAEAATGTTIDAESWAIGLRALRAVEGNSAHVTGLFDWLMTFGSNPANQLPSVSAVRDTGLSLSEKALAAGLMGTYDPRFALASPLKVRDGAPLADVKYEATGASYSLVSVGLMADLYSERQPARFKDLKDALGVPRPLTRGGLDDGRAFWLGTMGRCGLSLQPRTATSGTLGALSTYAASTVGLVYRRGPQAFAERGH